MVDFNCNSKACDGGMWGLSSSEVIVVFVVGLVEPTRKKTSKKRGFSKGSIYGHTISGNLDLLVPWLEKWQTNTLNTWNVLILLLGYACSVVGKSEPHTFPKTVGFHGDESHGIESVKNHLKQTKGSTQSNHVHDSFGSGSKRFGAA